MFIDPVIAAVRIAARLTQTVQATALHAITKQSLDQRGTEPVTIADYGAQALIAHAIARHFPDDAILAEESGAQFVELVSPGQREIICELLSEYTGERLTEADVIAWLDSNRDRPNARRTWTIDPVDGTKGFVNGRHYSLGVGWLEDGDVAGGIMACPGYGEISGALFYAHEGQAFYEPLTGGRARRLQARAHADGELIAVQSVEKAHASKERMARVRQLAGLEGATVRELDSMEKYALVAAGEADFYLRLPRPHTTDNNKVWDHAPGVALVQAAGGLVTDLDGGPLNFSRGAWMPNEGMIISSAPLHSRLLSAVRQVMTQEG